MTETKKCNVLLDLNTLKFDDPYDLDAFKNLEFSSKDYLIAMSTIIKPDPNNRAGAIIVEDTVERIRANFQFADLGIILIEQQPDGLFQMEDGHNRTEAMKRRQADGNFTDKDLVQPISVRVVPYGAGFRAYKNTNSGKPHSNQVKLMDPRYFCGRIMRKIEGVSRVLINGNRLQALANKVGVLALGVENEEYNAASAKGKRLIVKNINVDKEERPFTWSPEMEEKLVKAIGTVEYMLIRTQQVSKELGIKPKKLNKVLANAQFYGFLLLDAVSTRKMVTSRFDDEMAKRIIGNADDLERIVTVLAQRWDQDNLELYKILIGNATRAIKEARDETVKQLLKSSKNTVDKFVDLPKKKND